MKIQGYQFCMALCFVVLQFIITSSGHAEDKKARQIVRLISGETSYFYKLVELSLSMAGVRDQYELVYQHKGILSYSRLAMLIAKSEYIDIAAFSVNENRMQILRPIQQPLLFGLQGYRILLINKQDQHLFKDITSLKQLRRLQAGFVNGWADTQIMADNNLPTHIASDSSNVYAMLSLKRVEYFPRSLEEVTNNYNRNVVNHPNLAIEQHLALYYQLPVYFFLSKDNETLAAQLEFGLKQLAKSGQLHATFLEFFTPKIAEMNVEKRTVLLMENKQLPNNIVISPILDWIKPIENLVD